MHVITLSSLLNILNCIIKQCLGVSNLERLYIEHNKIRSIARDTFSNMSRLVELKLGWNRISIFPKITNSPSLRRVCLEQNRISRLLGTFSEVKLEQLTVCNKMNTLNFIIVLFSLCVTKQSIKIETCKYIAILKIGLEFIF